MKPGVGQKHYLEMYEMVLKPCAIHGTTLDIESRTCKICDSLKIYRGIKSDTGKPKIWAGVIGYFPNALVEIAQASEEGVNAESGRSWGDWTRVPDGFKRYTEAMMRHIIEEAQICEIADPHTQPDVELIKMRIKAATAVAWNALARLELLIGDLSE